MASTSIATADWLAKRIYKDGLDQDALTSGNQLLSHVERETDFTSAQGIFIPVPTSNGQGMGATNADAYTARAGTKGQTFVVPQRRMYHYGELDGHIVRNAEAGDDESQFANVLTRDVDGATENFGQEINQRLYGDYTGQRCLVSATTAPTTSTTLVLGNPEDTAFFAIDMLVSALNPADGTLRNSGASVLVTAIDPILGTLTGSTGWTTTIGALAASDILIRAGTRNASLDGLQGWCPVTPSSSFLGVNQTLNRSVNAGVYVDVSTESIRDGFLKAAAAAERMLGRGFNRKAPMFINPVDKFEIIRQVEAVKVVETSVSTKYNVGLEAVEVLGCTLISDRHCPIGRAFQVPKEAFTLGTAGQAPKIDDQDGRKFSYDRSTGKLCFSLAFDGNSYSRGVNSLVHIRLPVRSL